MTDINSELRQLEFEDYEIIPTKIRAVQVTIENIDLAADLLLGVLEIDYGRRSVERPNEPLTRIVRGGLPSVYPGDWISYLVEESSEPRIHDAREFPENWRKSDGVDD